MITNYKLDEINRMAVEDPGMADLLDRLHEYYLLKRPTPPTPTQSANDILDKIRLRRAAGAKVGRPPKAPTFSPANPVKSSIDLIGMIRARMKE